MLFFSLRKISSGNLFKTYSGKMLMSNTLVATFVLCLLISFTEISQGSGNQPNSGKEGMFGLRYYERLMYVWRSSV